MLRRSPAIPALLLGLALAAGAHAQTAPPRSGPDAGKGQPRAAPSRPPPAPAQPQAARPAPALLAAGQKIAGPFILSSADGSRACPMTLRAEAAGAVLAAVPDIPCPVISFVAQIVGWLPDPSGAIRLLAADGRTVAEFTEATGGAYEALREGDGVYFLTPPTAVVGVEVSPEEMIGDWILARAANAPPLCRWTLTDEPAPGGAFKVRVAAGCDAVLADFAAPIWRIEGGNVVVGGRPESTPLRFARQEDGGWAKTPERGRPLLLLRP
ncbi:protease inhibitor Inh/omp19 family protein [Aquabacter spiritensis]|uniref:Protease inhibitor Inh n=1 Tax=Aquabacter spiritensis TaxID=933073 RepID=A0A4R3M6B6_9HYPH|nr:protease inhibitor Inh/omp19 family protein [Aquabacter spiritensis]TCT08143.1 protease inhibitor Inh [Aquabacter spiritensis]